MSIKESDIKLLWGRAGGHCSLCREKVSEDKATANGAFQFGEQAHIVGEEESAPRGKSLLTREERNRYHNLILLCPTCHTKIDKNEPDYPVEKLHMVKTNHELAIQLVSSISTDPKKEAADSIYTYLIDAAVEKCFLTSWESWVSVALEQPPRWHQDWMDGVDHFRKAVLRAAWPNTFPELERALKTFSIYLEFALLRFTENATDMEGEWLLSRKFYRDFYGDPELAEFKKKEYSEWLENCRDMMICAAKSANWLGEVVRRDLQPMFFAVPGKFMVTEGPFGIQMSMTTRIYEFSDEEKRHEPDQVLSIIKTYKAIKSKADQELFGV